IPLTLGYFTILSSSFKATTGTLTERVDQALSRTAQGEEVSSSLNLKTKKTISTPIFLSVTALLIAVAISSRILF
ncbi:MAG: heptaprenyl diphosphate synthase, partial [Sphaerochaeta sp.]